MTTIRPATLADLKYIDALRKKEGDAIGFIPIQRYEMEVNRERLGTLVVAVDNGDLTGFLYATHSGHGSTHIQQVAIQEDARRVTRGRMLVDAAVADGVNRMSWLTSLRCADDLEANTFWQALDFALEREGVTPKSIYGSGKEKRAINKRGRKINVWQRTERGLWAAPAKFGGR